jgi:hypothetical protein
MITFPTLSQIPYIGGDPGGVGTLPVTPDGVGAVCQTDDDCSGDGVSTCITQGGIGFCTREGCGAGACGSGYLCCRDCSETVAAFLPFEGSACFPEDQVEQLLAAPASCTCD